MPQEHNPPATTSRGHSGYKHDTQKLPRVAQGNPAVTAGRHVTSPLPKDNNSMTIEGVEDLTSPKPPVVPEPHEQPVLPIDDPWKKMRLSKA